MTETIPSAGATADVPDYPKARPAGCPFDPPPQMYEIAERSPVSKVRWVDGNTPWMITRYRDLQSLFNDPRISSDPSSPNHPSRSVALRVIATTFGKSFVKMDAPNHQRLRQMVSSWFSVKRSDALRTKIQAAADGLIDDILAGPKPVDLVEAYAAKLPSFVICDMLGTPYSDHSFFQDNVATATGRNTTPEQAAEAHKEMWAYVDRLFGEKLENPTDDMVSEIAGRVKDGQLTRKEAVDMGCLLIVGGHDTTKNMISFGALTLLQHPDQLAIVRDTNDPKVIATAVEELLRYLTVAAQALPRTAKEDIEIGGQLIKADDGVVMACEMANRDPSVFPDPDRFDITRDARGHMAFGYGAHQCVGQMLARAELQIAYETLFKRIPTLQLATSLDQLQYRSDAVVYGVYELPVTW
jgi:cytochrome P450